MNKELLKISYVFEDEDNVSEASNFKHLNFKEIENFFNTIVLRSWIKMFLQELNH